MSLVEGLFDGDSETVNDMLSEAVVECVVVLEGVSVAERLVVVVPVADTLRDTDEV